MSQLLHAEGFHRSEYHLKAFTVVSIIWAAKLPRVKSIHTLSYCNIMLLYVHIIIVQA